MSQAEEESSEVGRVFEPFMVHPKFCTEDLLEESGFRLTMARAFLNLLACGHIRADFEEDVQEAAWGSVKLLDEAKALEEEYGRRMNERDRPRREAAEKRRKRAQVRARLVRTFVELETGRGKDKATARRVAREAIAELEAEGQLFAEPASTPPNGNGGAQ